MLTRIKTFAFSSNQKQIFDNILKGPGLWIFLAAFAIYALSGAYDSNFASDGDVMYGTTRQMTTHFSIYLQPSPYYPQQIVAGRDGLYVKQVWTWAAVGGCAILRIRTSSSTLFG